MELLDRVARSEEGARLAAHLAVLRGLAEGRVSHHQRFRLQSILDFLASKLQATQYQPPESQLLVVRKLNVWLDSN